MSVMRNILMHTFGRPQGILGRLGGIIMARTNADCGAWVSDLLKVEQNDNVLEVGFGPGVVIPISRNFWSRVRLLSRATVRWQAGPTEQAELEPRRPRRASGPGCGWWRTGSRPSRRHP